MPLVFCLLRVRVGLGVTMLLALVTLAVPTRVRVPIVPQTTPANILGVWRSLRASVRRLLLSDVFIRTCEGLVDVFVVLYAMNVIGITAPPYGALVAVQMVTAMLVCGVTADASVPPARLVFNWRA